MFASVLDIAGSMECGSDELSTLEGFGSSAIVEAELESSMVDVSKLENLKLYSSQASEKGFPKRAGAVLREAIREEDLWQGACQRGSMSVWISMA